MTKLAIIGKGNVGSALGATLSKADYQVTFGTKPGGDAAEAIARTGGKATQAPAAEAAAAADVVFLAVPGNVALEVAKGLGDLTGKVEIPERDHTVRSTRHSARHVRRDTRHDSAPSMVAELREERSRWALGCGARQHGEEPE